jgi:L-alanine-DL-glutamate epimerase-like enolase superfamily enzyme
MRVRRVETSVLSIPPRQKPIGDAQQKRVDAVEFVTVRLDTDAGLTGWGFNWNYTRGTRAVKVMIDDVYAPMVAGRDPGLRTALCRDLLHATHFIGRFGVARVGVAAINIALWDLRCKQAGQPLWKLLGATRGRVKAYNTDGGWLGLSKSELVEDMRRLVDRGFDRVKMKVGLPDPREDYERVKAVRRAIGDGVGLMVDVNTCWDLKTALHWGRKLEEFRLDWLEEPLPPFDVRGHAKLAEALDVPIAVGETLYSADMFRDFLESDAVQVVQADATKLAGVDEWLETAALANTFRAPVVPHTNVQQKLHVQLAAATPHAPMVEYCYESLANIWKEPLIVSDGHYPLPQEPGAGCELRPSVLSEFRVA